jgi:hypothetical protein
MMPMFLVRSRLVFLAVVVTPDHLCLSRRPPAAARGTLLPSIARRPT